jgi:ferredoxin
MKKAIQMKTSMAANSFNVSDSCTGCGTCVRACPRANIILEAGHPRFSDNCEFCHACIQWCPKFAISHPDFENEPKHYRHPNIRLNELIVNV